MDPTIHRSFVHAAGGTRHAGHPLGVVARDERPTRDGCRYRCTRGMDSFDTWPLILAPVLGAIVVCAVVIVTAVQR